MDRGTQIVLSRRRFDVDEYHRMLQAEVLYEDDRVELLAGEIVEMAPISSRHAAGVGRLQGVFIRALGERALVRIQQPVRLDRYSEPEPDVALVRPRADEYAGGHPGPADTFLVVEVADSSLPVDRRVKLPLYAATGIPEVWIIDLTADTVEIHREPRDRSYESHRVISEGSITPSAFPDLSLDVTDVLPPKVQSPEPDAT